MYYFHTDYLGNYETITNESDNIVDKLSFDPWGRRNPLTWTYNNVPQTHLFDRGFTGHEQLDAFKLIDMKGRAYDPFVARFLSVDPTIQFPQNSQSYNRYSYALNNPLKFTDPSGFSLDWFINEKTNAVYYKNTYTKGDEDKIKGEGWTWFGNDNVFGKDALQVLWENGNLLATHNMNAESGKSIVSFNVEASLKGQKALTFMKKMGYEFKPVQQTIYEKTSEVWAPGPGSHDFTFLTGEIIKITEKSRYLKKGMTEMNRYPIKVMRDPSYLPFIMEKVGRYRINYTDNTYLKFSLFTNKLLKVMGGTHDFRRTWEFNNWSEYWKNIKLISNFTEKNGYE